MEQRVDVAIVGGGIVGLAHAWAAARRGLSAVVFERDRHAQGASIRNFGMVWPIGQPPGPQHHAALRSRARWLELAEHAGIWVHPCGSLHLAYHADELAVLEEFVPRVAAEAFDCRLLTPRETVERCAAVQPEGLLGALWSPTELCVDPRQAIARLPAWLHETFGVQLRFGQTVVGVEMPEVRTASGERWQADRVLVCGGVDFQTLFPAVYAASGLRRCKLQMMRTAPQPDGWRLGPHLAGGLTLCHYSAFQDCPGLPALQRRIHETMPEYLRFGIHVMASQNHLGEVVIGDSHEYEDEISIFDKSMIDDLILRYLRGLVRLPEWTIAQRWHGTYARHPTLPQFTAEPQKGVTILASPGGAGMTLSFGLADEWWERAGR
jgi:FAD dependent oxidoreductase TIGR03364